jgi:hypothetical protein
MHTRQDRWIQKELAFTQRMSQNRIPLKSYHYSPQGKRTNGRPKKRWREQLMMMMMMMVVMMIIHKMYKHIRTTNIQLIQLWLLSETVASFANCSNGAIA